MRRPFPARRDDWIAYATLGVFANAAYLGFTYAALGSGLAAGIASIVASTNPLILALVAPRLLGESLTVRKVLGLLLGFGGVLFVVLARTGMETARPLEIVLALTGVVANVASTVLFKRAQGLQRFDGDQHDSTARGRSSGDPRRRVDVRSTVSAAYG
ncbi:MAG TPA: EamA family transporter [Chloroflexota bacterium]